MALDEQNAVRAQYAAPDRLNRRISLHEKYSVNRQGFGNWIVSHYRLEEGMAVLELGCGSGKMWAGRESLIKKCAPLVLSDFSEGMLLEAKETLRGQEGIEFQVIDMQSIPFADHTFDAVIANMMLYHVPDIEKALSEAKRVLKPGGTFYSATYGEHGILEFLCGLFQQEGVRDSGNHSFTLQNGKSQLQAFFSDVRRYDYQDALAVTDAEDMADYMFSLPGLTRLRQLPRETVVSVLKAHMVEGVLHVPKEYGMFVSK